ncbi:MAG TPA: tetratricopeptide repeat protein [Pyrinomonadaceae bacterium]|jgi:tetratricopeptide (TPR) repeat protein|nr:tetratricopeptide repeat protein [Pyrinomonadaceae bacterium]
MKRLVLTLATTFCLLLIVQAAPAKDTWTSVRSKNFFLIGNASEKDIRRVATRLEQFRDVFTRLLSKADFNSPVPTTVVVFKSNSSYKPFKPVVDGKISEVAGYFQAGEEINYITLTTEANGENPYSTIYHEYVHLLINNNFGKANVPPWFNEGLAEYYSTFDIEDDQKVYLGRLIANHILLLRQQRQLVPLKTLFEVDYASLHRNKREAKGIFYAQSWALVHYLILGNNGERRPQMNQFFSLMSKNVPTEQAFRQAFQTDFATMEKELKKYIEGRNFQEQVATFEKKLEYDSTMQSAPLSEAEADSHLGDLLLHTNRLDEAATLLQQALNLDPKEAMAHASLGVVRLRQNRFDEAKQHLQQAIASNSQNYLAYYYYAYELSRAGMSEDGRVSSYPAETAREMRVALQKAMKLKPDFPGTYHLQAWVNLVTGEQLDESIELIKKARTLSPGNEEYAFVLAQIYLRQQNFEAARQTIEPLARSGSDPQMRANAQSLLRAVSDMQEQIARYKEMQEASATGTSNNDSSPPTPRRRGQEGDTAENKEAEERSVADATASALQEALRKPLAGETQVQGLLTRIECGAKGLIFHIKVNGRVLKLQSESFESIQITAFTQEAGNEISCGVRKQENAVVIVYRPSADGRSKTDGIMLAMDFVPANFQLKQ